MKNSRPSKNEQDDKSEASKAGSIGKGSVVPFGEAENVETATTTKKKKKSKSRSTTCTKSVRGKGGYISLGKDDEATITTSKTSSTTRSSGTSASRGSRKGRVVVPLGQAEEVTTTKKKTSTRSSSTTNKKSKGRRVPLANLLEAMTKPKTTSKTRSVDTTAVTSNNSDKNSNDTPRTCKSTLAGIRRLISFRSAKDTEQANQKRARTDSADTDETAEESRWQKLVSSLRLPSVARWKLLLVIGIILVGISVGVFVAHVRAKQPFEANTDNVDYWNGQDDYYQTDNHEEDLFVPPESSPCGPIVWPELVGMHVNRARDVILAQNSCVVVELVVDGSKAADEARESDYDPERVRLYMDRDTGRVSRIPRVG